MYAHPIVAQVVPDNTLPVGERSQVIGNPNAQIDGGARRGGNLFHSFSQFSIPTGGAAYFNNAIDIRNIFSRVTGGSVSNIDGLIRANGTANLFLLNPNGILFGPNARLNIGGSFVATTADSINFADNFQYSATHSQTPPLLTVSVPVGLQMGANPGSIAVRGSGYNLSVAVPIFTPLIRGSSTTGLRVPAGQTLALIGGDIDINGGTLTAEQGRIELGSVRGGQVSLSDGFTFSYPGVQTFGNIRLSRQALADASGGGLIQVQGNQISLSDGSLLFIQNQGTQTGGSIKVNAVRSLELSGTSPANTFSGGIDTQAEGVGQGADITISTQHLFIRDAAEIQTDSHASGRSGNVVIQVSNSTQVLGSSPISPILYSSVGTGTYGAGDAGDVILSTRELTVLDGGTIGVGTFGTGRGGNVTVNALDFIKVSGQSFLPSVSNIVAIAVVGDAGRLTVNTSRLILQNGGTISTSTLGDGNAGSVIINARESVELSSTAPGSSAPSFVGSSAPILIEPLRQLYGLPDRPNGNSGSVIINTPRLSIRDGTAVTVSNDGTGVAGTLRVNTNSIVLDRGGSITAATASGEGGNIELNVRDFILLRNGSPITASAGGTGNGGNIRIDAGLIVALPNENSDIRANSVNARGGNISITASGIFGIQPRPQDTPLSDITATGANSAFNGTVQLNIDRLDPTASLIQLPSGVVDPSRFIAQGCPADRGNSFVITGRGGLPPTPQQALDDDAEWSDRRTLAVLQRRGQGDAGTGGHGDTETRRRGDENPTPHTLHPTPHPPITEATGWQTTPTGEIILIANTANSMVQNSLNSLQNGLHPSTFCQGK
ncbi:S-layer family protein [Kovacikia minuta CCNUW1]|uniref:beta strand repeat-containing protein n=1 Tax=Kovacikia minuta TaxID=2931930 RepID=UPI001CCB2139|nr:S-layer family protein [Kovacikia minuta]UBF27104.1 S-layer family protein [Kovacikia minuta CCNUW1]